jgi:hypothetical protein
MRRKEKDTDPESNFNTDNASENFCEKESANAMKSYSFLKEIINCW